MEQELEVLESRLGQLLGNMHRLIEANQRLVAELEQSQSVNVELRQRIAEARARVELALARLPADSPPISDQPLPGDASANPGTDQPTAAAA